MTKEFVPDVKQAQECLTACRLKKFQCRRFLRHGQQLIKACWTFQNLSHWSREISVVQFPGRFLSHFSYTCVCVHNHTHTRGRASKSLWNNRVKHTNLFWLKTCFKIFVLKSRFFSWHTLSAYYERRVCARSFLGLKINSHKSTSKERSWKTKLKVTHVLLQSIFEIRA